MAWCTHRTPSTVDHVQKQTVLVDDRGVGAPAVARETAELFAQELLPDQVAQGVVTNNRTRYALSVDVSRLGIDHRAGPTRAVVGHGGELGGQGALPKRRAILGIKRRENLASILSRTGATGDKDLAVVNHRRRAANEILTPDHVFTRLRRPGRDQSGFLRHAQLRRTTPRGPVRRECGKSGKEQPKGRERESQRRAPGDSRAE